MLLYCQAYGKFNVTEVSKISGCDVRCRSTFWSDSDAEQDSKEWLDIRPTETETRYLVHLGIFYIHAIDPQMIVTPRKL